MRGKLRYYRGDPAAAVAYVEADRSSAEEFSLADGTGVARRFCADADGAVREQSALTAASYASWVAGMDPDDGSPKGRLRSDARAVRFVELTINGPKTWSLAAELYPDIAAAYDAAQDGAAAQVIGWLGRNATTRVTTDKVQVQVPVERLEAITVRHYTSRSGDPHRHLHLQVNARVFAAGAWRGLHTAGVRGCVSAIQGIGHAAMRSDPAFRRALAAHGFSLDESGEIGQLAPYVRSFSQRAAQIETNLARYEAAWQQTHPGQQPGARMRRRWNARAWAEDRPGKQALVTRADLNRRWRAQLAELGYRERDQPVELTSPPVGAIDRDGAAEEVLYRLSSATSAWSAARIRGEVEQLIARRGYVLDGAARTELAENLTARVGRQCLRVADGCEDIVRPGATPAHIRALSSRRVRDVERDIAKRLAVRGARPGSDIDPSLLARRHDTGERLDDRVARAVSVLGGDRCLVVISAAGPDPRAIVDRAREVLRQQGHSVVAVTAAGAAELGADPIRQSRLRAGDLLVIEDAGRVDQDTAQALLQIADKRGARVAFIGQAGLGATGEVRGRGGAFDLARRWADPEAVVLLGDGTGARDAAALRRPRSRRSVVHDLRQTWDIQSDAHATLQLRPRLERAIAEAPRVAADRASLAAAHKRWRNAQRAHVDAQAMADATEQAVTGTADGILARLEACWNAQRGAAQADARIAHDTSNRFGRGRQDVDNATARLRGWAMQWQPVLGELMAEMNLRPDELVAFALRHPSNDHIGERLRAHARDQAGLVHPEQAHHQSAARAALEKVRVAQDEYRLIRRDVTGRQQPDDHLAAPGPISRMQHEVLNSERRLANVERRLAALCAEPAVSAQPAPAQWLDRQRDQWRAERAALRDARRLAMVATAACDGHSLGSDHAAVQRDDGVGIASKRDARGFPSAPGRSGVVIRTDARALSFV
ncbi:MAG: relaxase domain-containing protein [Actinomycetota bacterium]|nr:relaxase domain-containing protein [Actinomycetota bacterium]